MGFEDKTAWDFAMVALENGAVPFDPVHMTLSKEDRLAS